MGFRFNPITGDLDLDSSDPFITDGIDGITSIRWHASDGSLWDMTIDASGAVVTTRVGNTAGTMIATGPMYGLTYTT